MAHHRRSSLTGEAKHITLRSCLVVLYFDPTTLIEIAVNIKFPCLMTFSFFLFTAVRLHSTSQNLQSRRALFQTFFGSADPSKIHTLFQTWFSDSIPNQFLLNQIQTKSNQIQTKIMKIYTHFSNHSTRHLFS